MNDGFDIINVLKDAIDWNGMPKFKYQLTTDRRPIKCLSSPIFADSETTYDKHTYITYLYTRENSPNKKDKKKKKYHSRKCTEINTTSK